MSHPPDLKIYHITHLNNLSSILQSGHLYSDAWMLQNSLAVENIGMSDIKLRRLHNIEVTPYSGTKVGEYVPFYWCPRSVMLYIIYRGNNTDLAYKGGQTPILHLQSDLNTVLAYAAQHQIKWAFSPTNAGAYYTRFFNSTNDLSEINWQAVQSSDFSNSSVKDKKQAEFLLYEAFPFSLVEKIGVYDQNRQTQTQALLPSHSHPIVQIERGWYF